MTYKRRVLAGLTKPDLLGLGRAFELEITQQMSQSELLDVVVGSKRATLDKILPALKDPALNRIARALGLEVGDGARETLISRILKGSPEVHFAVTAGLKRIIGRDLITNEFVAIFEIVKNSFDAHARRVDLLFQDDKNLIVVDDGKGMSVEDIKEKWLFVAYSAKNDGTEDAQGYRDRIGAKKKDYAGSKGVGRFSCDRLGERLKMQTRSGAAGAPVEVVDVDWSLFENTSRERFEEIPVELTHTSSFDIPADLPQITQGTVLGIMGLREEWDRDKLLKLRSAIAKLINPFASHSDKFEIHLSVPAERANDAEATVRAKAAKARARAKGKAEEDLEAKVVNGPIGNFIFEALKGKTTHLETEVVGDGKRSYIESRLTDRGALIYRIREPNPYKLLKGSGFACNLFYLNKSSKHTFTVRMGVSPVQFGSVFLFRHGFRVFPIGDEADDTFGIDRRKQQGYARFLGTRDIIGRLDVAGSEENFRESSSRDKGLVKTPAYGELVKCFLEHCFKRLERYVVGVTWEIPDDADVEDTSRLRGDKASARIAEIVAKLAGTAGVELLEYNHDLIRIVDERSEDFNRSLESLRVLAEKKNDAKLLRVVSIAAKRYTELQRAEAAARETAERERAIRVEAERKAAEAQAQAQQAQAQAQQAQAQAQQAQASFAEERKRNLFLTSLTSLDRETIELLHHQIIIHAAAVNELLLGQFAALRRGTAPTKDNVTSVLESISFQNQSILSIARFATKANFRLDSDTIQADLAGYVVEYIEKIAPMFSDNGIMMKVSSSAKGMVRKFKPIEINILVDNMISNAGRANATTISFAIEQPTTRQLKIVVQDDGRGLDPSVTDLQRLFEKGFTTTKGSGMGLLHVVRILERLGGSITAERTSIGARFVIHIKMSDAEKKANEAHVADVNKS